MEVQSELVSIVVLGTTSTASLTWCNYLSYCDLYLPYFGIVCDFITWPISGSCVDQLPYMIVHRKTAAILVGSIHWAGVRQTAPTFSVTDRKSRCSSHLDVECTPCWRLTKSTDFHAVIASSPIWRASLFIHRYQYSVDISKLLFQLLMVLVENVQSYDAIYPEICLKSLFSGSLENSGRFGSFALTNSWRSWCSENTASTTSVHMCINIQS